MTDKRTLLTALLLSSAAFGHGGTHELHSEEVMRWWTVDPLVIALLLVTTVAYLLGVRSLWARAGVGRGIRRFEVGCFFAAQLSVVIALLSPLDRLSDLLFSAHMTQHELLMLVSAPLTVLGKPLYAFLFAFPEQRREQLGQWVQRPGIAKGWRVITGPLFVAVAHGLAVWLWHIPALFQAALHHDGVHAVQHTMFFVSAALFFWSLVHGRYGRLGYGLAVVYVFLTATHTGLLGALLTFARGLWYPDYAARSEGVGHGALEDQQLAGVIMWVPAGFIFVLVALALFAAWIGEAERRERHSPMSELLKRNANKAPLLVLLVCAGLGLQGCSRSKQEAAGLTGGNADHGRVLLKDLGCGTCHIIPGVLNATGTVGPSLKGIALRSYLAGQKENSVANLIRWIQHPRQMIPGTAMPEVGVDEAQARDIAAYLYTLKD